MNKSISFFFYLLVSFCILSCKNESNNQLNVSNVGEKIVLKYAKGFSITTFDSYKVLEINNPWPEADNSFKYILSDTSIKTPINKIVVTSTTHIPALELLGVEQTLVGFPGTDYISSEITRTRIDSGYVRELGTNNSINIEVLLELKPDLVIGFGIDGNNKSFETIRKSNIPVFYNGDWVENSPLAKAEWIKFFGVLYDKEKRADSIFNAIENDYLNAKFIAEKVEKQPTVLCGAMHKDIWYLPKSTSVEGQFLNDANVNYLWQDTSGSGSSALSFESVFSKGKNAEIWLSPSYYKSLTELEQANNHYTKFDAFKNKKVFSFSTTTGETGGVLYYELGLARPDLVLKDIIKICHPELLNEYEPFFFKPLE